MREIATTLMKYCPHRILVLDITPCDAAWAHHHKHQHPSRKASEKSFTLLAQRAMKALKKDIRNVFAPLLTVYGQPSQVHNPLGQHGLSGRSA